MTSRLFTKGWKAIALVAVFAMGLGISGCSEESSVTNPKTGSLNPTGSIQGRLTDRTTGEPIVGAVIDIGVGSATTNSLGTFTIRDVPATSNANGQPQGEYVGTIDLRNVTSPVKMNDSTYTGFKYPKYEPFSISVAFSSFEETKGGDAPGSGSGAGNDTPIVGLMATCDPSVGKLATSIDVLVVNSSNLAPVGAGYTVTVLRGLEAVFTGTTDANGRVTAPNLQSRTSYLISAIAPDKSKFGDHNYTTPVDGKTLTLIAQSNTGSDLLVGPPVKVSTTDQVAPAVASTSPGANADLSMPNDNLVFLINFSEPIANTTAYALALTPGASSISGLWNDVVVNFNGAKAGNIVHSLAWNSNTQLAVSFPPLAPSSKYSVTLGAGVCTNLKDLNGNNLTGCPFTRNFTTSSTGAVAAATNVVVVNAATIDYNTLPVNLDWPPASGAYAYNVYRSKVRMLGGYAGTEAGGAYEQVGTKVTASQFTDTLAANAYVDGQNQVFFRYKVVSLNSDYAESATSDFATAKDVVAPGLAAPPTAAFRADYADGNNTLNVLFNEPVDEVSAEVAGNYDVWGFNGLTKVTVTKAFMNADLRTVTLTLDATMDNNVGGTFRPLVWPHVKAGADFACSTLVNVNDGAAATVQPYLAAQPAYQFVCATVDNVLNPLPTPGAGDVLLADNTAIVAGGDGVCNTGAQANATIVHAVGQVSPEFICLTSGTDLDIDSTISAADVAVYPVVVTVTGVKDIAGNDIDATRNAIGTDGPAQ